MSADVTPRVDADGPGGEEFQDPSKRFGWGYGRSGLVVPLIIAAFSTYLLVNSLIMAVPEGTDPPGPRLVPLIISIVGLIVAVLYVIAIIRKSDPPVPPTYSADDDVSDEQRAAAEASARVPYKFYSDWASLAWAIGGFIVFALTLPFLGWILGAALLFWCMARAMGSTRALFDLSLGLVVGSVSYLCFATLLGLNLPSGILGGGF